MITLTTPPTVLSTLGGTSTVAYDKMVLTNISFNTVAMSVNADVRMTSTGSPDMQPITGSLVADTATAKATISVPYLNFFRKISLTGPQNSNLQAQIRAAQDDLESGLITLVLVDGTQATGT